MFKITNVHNKTNDWKLLTIISDQGGAEYTEVSANRVDKKGEHFPNFDGLVVGAEVNGRLWTAPSGKNFLFPATEYKATSFARAPKGIAAAQERKAEYIAEAQTRKNDSIAYFNSINAAISLLGAIYAKPENDFAAQQFIVFWRDWFLEQYKEHEDKQAKKIDPTNNPPF